MPALNGSPTRFSPPLWLTVGIAALIAAGLLGAFVDTLQDHLRHGAELRQAQRAAASGTTARVVTTADSQIVAQNPQR